MSYDEYWNGDVWLIHAYRKADKLRINRKNEELWLQGMYFYEAIAKVSPLFNPFAKKGTTAIPYSEKPYGLYAQKSEALPTEQEIENERLKARLFFDSWGKATQKKFRE